MKRRNRIPLLKLVTLIMLVGSAIVLVVMSLSVIIIIFFICMLFYLSFLFIRSFIRKYKLKKQNSLNTVEVIDNVNNKLLNDTNNIANNDLLINKENTMIKTIYIYDYYDDLFEDAARFVIEKKIAYTSMIQRMLKIGPNRASRIMEQLEEAGIISPTDEIKHSEVLISLEQFEKFMYKFSKPRKEIIDTELSEAKSQDNTYTSKSQITYDDMTGEEFEKFCVVILSKNNFINVKQTKSSGDQGVDILAEKDGIKYAIQCKCYSKPVGNHAIQEVYSGKNYYNCHVGVVLTNQTFTESAITLANKTNILLWDRKVLNKLITSISLSGN